MARFCLASCVVLVACASAFGQDSSELLTGAEFRQAMASVTDIVWNDDRALRPALERLVETKRVAIILDRRVDPEQTINITVSDQPLEQALRQIAAQQKLGIAIFDSTIYLGPESTTRRLATVAVVQHEKATKGAGANAKSLKRLPALQTEALSTPRELLDAWADSCQIELHDADRAPHDLWPALSFPSQSAASRATLLLAGFDLAIEFAVDGAAARVVDLPADPTLTRTYDGGGNPRNLAQQLTDKFPAAEIRVQGRQLAVAGPFEIHEDIARLLRGETIRRPSTTTSEKRYTVAVENKPLEVVITKLAEQAKLTVEFDAAITPATKQKLVSFEVKDVKLEALFAVALKPLGLEFVLTEDKLSVKPAK